MDKKVRVAARTNVPIASGKGNGRFGMNVKEKVAHA
jgi:hypothetical protein